MHAGQHTFRFLLIAVAILGNAVGNRAATVASVSRGREARICSPRRDGVCTGYTKPASSEARISVEEFGVPSFETCCPAPLQQSKGDTPRYICAICFTYKQSAREYCSTGSARGAFDWIGACVSPDTGSKALWSSLCCLRQSICATRAVGSFRHTPQFRREDSRGSDAASGLRGGTGASSLCQMGTGTCMKTAANSCLPPQHSPSRCHPGATRMPGTTVQVPKHLLKHACTRFIGKEEASAGATEYLVALRTAEHVHSTCCSLGFGNCSRPKTRCGAQDLRCGNCVSTYRQTMRGGRRWTRWSGCSSTRRTSSACPRCAKSTPRSSRRVLAPGHAARVLRLCCVGCLLYIVLVVLIVSLEM